VIENIIPNRELFPDVLPESQATTWLIPTAPEVEASMWPWPVSQTGPLMRTALPALALSSKNLTGLVKSNGHIGQQQKLLAATNTVTLSPWLLPYRTIGIYMNGVVINFVDITRFKQTEEKLRQKQQQLESVNKNLEELVAERTEQVRRLASEVMIAEQRVQQAVSQILHDELQQILFSIEIQTAMLHSALPASEQALLDQTQEIRNTVNLAFQTTRQMAIDLVPPLWLHPNFLESLDFLVAFMEKQYGLKVELKRPQLSNDPREEVSNLLSQIVRELLFNVVKHAGVNQATVEVFEEDGHLRVEVLDHGQGFDMAAAMTEVRQGSSLGLASIRNRLELFGGQFHIESQVGQGTRVAVATLI